jgi:CubicO group peptidase (beta-lactamase class C family)
MLMAAKYVSWKILCFACTSLFACQSIARDPVEKNQGTREMDSIELAKYRGGLTIFFDSLLNSNRFSGGILVAKNGQVIYEHYQGDVFGDNLHSINSATPFHVASTSKTFTSTSVLQLESRGLLSLGDSLQKFWPDFPYQGITVRNLLNHSSGIPDYANFLPKYGWDKKVTATNWDVLNTITNKYPSLDFKTGSRFKYCNTNFVLLALLVEKLSGLSFPFYVKENIFDVAGMKDSYVLSPFNMGDYMPSFTANGRMYNFDYLDGLYGDKNVYTTCRDLLKYDSAIRVGALLDPLAFEKAWEPNFRDTKYDEPWEYYGLGWRLKVFENNLKIPYHNGWWHGSNAVFQRLVADTAVIIVTGNRMNRKIYSSAKAANTFRTYYPDSLLQTMGEETESTLGDSLPGSAPGSKKAELPGGQTGSSTGNHEKTSSKTAKSPPGL